jgi:hypothetical protein
LQSLISTARKEGLFEKDFVSGIMSVIAFFRFPATALLSIMKKKKIDKDSISKMHRGSAKRSAEGQNKDFSQGMSLKLNARYKTILFQCCETTLM